MLESVKMTNIVARAGMPPGEAAQVGDLAMCGSGS